VAGNGACFHPFPLTITPQPVQLHSLAGSACHDDGWQWLPLAEAVDAGVPAPVRKLCCRPKACAD